ncbi:MAG TPA: AMP-binding protein [Terriglobia bacterium]|nr:AMP-binding protein [Terriglobia bacterium]
MPSSLRPYSSLPTDSHRDERTLPRLFLDTARRNWRRFAMADSTGRRLSFGEALVGAMLLRRLVLDECPSARDERMIGLLLPPSVPTALLNAGIGMAGRVPVNLNYTSSLESLEISVRRCGMRSIFTSRKLAEHASLPETLGGARLVMMEDFAQAMPRAHKAFYWAVARLLPRSILARWLIPRGLSFQSLATVIFSSGSVGAPKGVMLSHQNIISNIEAVQQAIHVTRSDCILGILPVFHAFGFTVGLWLPLVSGFSVVFHSDPREARTIAKLCRKYRATILVTTPTFAWEYVRRLAREDFASLRLAIVGAEKMTLELARAFKEKFGHELYQGYGSTELSPVVSVETPDDFEGAGLGPGSRRDTVGRPIPGVAARVVDLQTGSDSAPGAEGMLLIRGPSVMMGYLDDPARTREVIRDDGWYVTGDLARLDADGFITITDRLTRFSKIGGEMVPHAQVEEALQKALGTAQPRFVVAGIPDEQRGERLVVLHTELDLSVDELLRRLRDSSLPRLWLPKRENFFRVDTLPVLGSGKLDLKSVKDLAQRLASAAPSPEGAKSL